MTARRWLVFLHRAEDALLAALVGALLLLSVAQIALRVFFDSGLDWAEAASRAGVLWVALLGALGATRGHKHIAIDALPRVLPAGPRRAAWAIAHGAAALASGALAWLGWGMVRLEQGAPVPFIEGIPSWVPMLALPAGFGLMALRFVAAAAAPPPPVAGEGGA